MKKKYSLLLFVSCFFLFANSHGQTVAENAKAMFAKTKSIKTITYTMKKTERIKGKPVLQISSARS